MSTPYINRFLELIPSTPSPFYLKNPSDFSRERKLPFDKLITLILSLVSSPGQKGVDIKSREFFRMSRYCGLWPEATPVHRSSITKGRNKISWQLFDDILTDAVDLAYDVWPKSNQYQWQGRDVFAFDGSKFLLPATEKIRSNYDPNSGLETNGKGHYPQCHVTTVYDVFRRIPLGRIVAPVSCSEREAALKLFEKLPPRGILLFDKGYPGFEFFDKLNKTYEGDYLFHSPARSTFIPVMKFVKSNKKEQIIQLEPPSYYTRKTNTREDEPQTTTPITLRAIRMQNPDGCISVLLTSLLDTRKYSLKKITRLYQRRWEIETFYRHEKCYMNLEEFHSKSINGILQEMYASLIISVITASMITLPIGDKKMRKKQVAEEKKCERRVHFKNAVMTFSTGVSLLVARAPERAMIILQELLQEIRQVIYYKPIINRKTQPRISKKPINKWTQRKNKRLQGDYDA